eukprot:2538-Heterococcus_DN1.PRE.1
MTEAYHCNSVVAAAAAVAHRSWQNAFAQSTSDLREVVLTHASPSLYYIYIQAHSAIHFSVCVKRTTNATAY